MKLTTKQKLFITRMTENPEQAEWGFEILLKREDFSTFFDHLIEANLFSPENNIGPIPAEDPQFVRIPYWKALDYLEAIAELSGNTNDLELAEKVLKIIRSVSTYCDPDCDSRDNYHTFRKFAKFFGLVPTISIKKEDLELIPIWLSSRYDRGLVARALDKGVLKRLLLSEKPNDWEKACIILNYCTSIKWINENGSEEGRKIVKSIVEAYWLKELVKNQVSAFGEKAGKEAAQIFRNRVQEIFGEQYGDIPTYLSRPAVEDHEQNHSWDKVVNCFVDGLRDVILSWIEIEPEEAKNFVLEMFDDENEMIKRIALHILNIKWPKLNSLYRKVLEPQLFNSRYIHELYLLLNNRFSSFAEADKTNTLNVIAQLTVGKDIEDPDRYLRYIQRNWLSAIVNKGSKEVDDWYNELDSDVSIGKLSKNPSFHFYMESGWGPGPSPYTTQELLAFAENGILIKRLNTFKQPKTIRGTTKKSLVKSLEESVVLNPNLLLKLIPKFIEAKRCYQYGIISGFKKLWNDPKKNEINIDWNHVWSELISFFETLLNDDKFWIEEVVQCQDLTPTRDWIPPIISEFIEAGTKKDDNAFSAEYLPRTFSLIKLLLRNSEAVDEPNEDAMTQAINSPKGKAIEALFSHSLRVCRINDKNSGNHLTAWKEISPIYDEEMEKCKNANFEFTTLSAAYLSNIEYMNKEWLENNIDNIFPIGYPANFTCAIDGSSYAPASKSIYNLLNNNNIIENALKNKDIREQSRERLVERIALAYLWDDETLESARFKYIISTRNITDLISISDFFWSIRGQKNSENTIVKTIEFWDLCFHKIKDINDHNKLLFSSLSKLACYITKVDEKEYKLMLNAAPFIKVGYNADYFIEELDRLVEKGPERISKILGKVLENYSPNYDYKDRLKNLLIKLAKNGRLEDVLIYIDQIRSLPGIKEVYIKLTGAK